MSEQKEILKLCKIKKQTKEYPLGVSVNLTVMSGEMLGIVGMTASGKSLLAKIMTGGDIPDSGEVFFLGEKCDAKTLRDNTRYMSGENKIIGGLCVAENIFLGKVQEFSRLFSIDSERLHCKSMASLSGVGLYNVSPDDMAYTLSTGEKKLVELARCIFHRPKLIVLDEAFEAIDHNFRERIRKILDGYVRAGGAVVFFSRDIEQARSLCKKLAVIRNGKLCDICNKDDICYNDYEIYDRPKVSTDGCEMILRAVNLCCGRLLNNINIKLCREEITGVVGLSQSGIHMLGEALFGARRTERGRITVRGRAVRSIHGAMMRKMSYARSDLGYDKILDILRGDSEIFILDSIFDGCTKEEIADLKDHMINACMRGSAIIFISEDIDQHMRMCDTIIVLRDGIQTAIIDGGDCGYCRSQIAGYVTGIV